MHARARFFGRSFLRVESNNTGFGFKDEPYILAVENLIRELADKSAAFKAEKEEVLGAYPSLIHFEVADPKFLTQVNRVNKTMTTIDNYLAIADSYVNHQEKILESLRDSLQRNLTHKIKAVNIDKFDDEFVELRKILHRCIKAHFPKNQIPNIYKEFVADPNNDRIIHVVGAINKILRNDQKKYPHAICKNLQKQVREYFNKQPQGFYFSLASYKKFPEQISLDMGKIDARIYQEAIAEEKRRDIHFILEMPKRKTPFKKIVKSINDAMKSLKEFVEKNLLTTFKSRINILNIEINKRVRINKLLLEHRDYLNGISLKHHKVLQKNPGLQQQFENMHKNLTALKTSEPETEESLQLEKNLQAWQKEFDLSLSVHFGSVETQAERVEEEKALENYDALLQALYTKISNEILGSELLRKHFPGLVQAIMKNPENKDPEKMRSDFRTRVTQFLSSTNNLNAKQPLLSQVPESVNMLISIFSSFTPVALNKPSSLDQLMKAVDSWRTNYQDELHPVPQRRSVFGRRAR